MNANRAKATVDFALMILFVSLAIRALFLRTMIAKHVLNGMELDAIVAILQNAQLVPRHTLLSHHQTTPPALIVLEQSIAITVA